MELFDPDGRPRESPHFIAPESVFLHVTKACTLRCSYCYFSASQPLPDEMTEKDLVQLWPDLVTLRARKLVFTGGEPLLRPDLMALLDSMRAADPAGIVLRCLNTNGQLVTRAVARALVGRVDEVRVSIDALAARNDALRGAGSFNAALRALDHFYSVGFEPKALVTVTSESLPDLEELLCLLASRHVTRVNLNCFRPIGRGAGRPGWAVNPADVRHAVRRAWQRCFPDRPAPAPEYEHEAQTNCGVGSFVNILPNGDVFPCHVLTHPEFKCGDVRRERLVDICRRTGFLGRLHALDFGELAERDGRLHGLTAGTCLGDVYAGLTRTTSQSHLLRFFTSDPAWTGDGGTQMKECE